MKVHAIKKSLGGSLKLGLMVAWSLPIQAQASADFLRQKEKGTAIVAGTVIENWRGCEKDATCGLRLRCAHGLHC